ncbi:hypothetical protein Cs7R123_01140 [Catellatospora sp. TT07R-123]|uniref:histidine phosphatase family protein n=1 Tax=Catellatospora sp. TT07R-123 TaxID=2733863 RepID=UPI001B1BF0A6|nr:histidine phosphatase family protein [Catellatospora sp. TT07R-123]GHJ42772.1 hypothetical protein Cs7R123_01140 [Catellatospora sp. TT07R-123]
MPFDLHLTLELVPHCSSVERAGWTAGHDSRPLSEQGFAQAERLMAALGAGIDAVYASPALRCHQTVAPLARAAGLPVTTLAALVEADDFREPAAWVDGVFAPMGQAVGAAWSAGVMLGALLTMAGAHPGGRVVASSHGDVIPVLLALISGWYAVPLPEPVGRGGWYTIRLHGGRASIAAAMPS